MMHNVPVQSLIDHIKTAIDVDPWAKEMAEELLKEQEPIWNDVLNVWTCPSCGQMVSTNYCRDCGRKVKWE